MAHSLLQLQLQSYTLQHKFSEEYNHALSTP